MQQSCPVIALGTRSRIISTFLLLLGDSIMELKCPLTIEEQLEKLQSHGIIIENIDEAKGFLQTVSYYRLTGYILHFRKNPSNSDLIAEHLFSEIIKIYDFDLKLRSLIRQYIEINEVYYKTHISNIFALEKCTEPPYNQHYNPDNYFNKDGFNKTMECFEKEEQYYTDSLIVKHHKQNYEGKMPLWAMFELMSFSNVSMLYKAMYKTSQENIASLIGVGSKTLINHLHCMSVLRNKCAHTARLINTRYNPPARLSAKFLRDNPSVNNDSLFAYIKVLIYRLPADSLREEFKNQIIKLIEEYKDVVDLSLIGFPVNYKSVM